MKKLLALIAFYGILSASFAQVPVDQLYASDQLIVKLNSSTMQSLETPGDVRTLDSEAFHQLNSRFALERSRLTGNPHTKNTYVLKFNTSDNLMYIMQSYEQTGLFEFVEPNFIGSGAGKRGCAQTLPNDQYFDRQWGLLNDGSFTLSPATEDADVDMDLAWDIEQGSSDIIVASLDSGVKMDHPEFAGRIWANAAESADGSDSDSNGYTDDTSGWDFANDDNWPADDHGHGSNVTSIFGANADNDVGYAGVDWNCQLMILKILDNNNLGFYSWWTDAIYYATDNGAKVMNMSVGGSGFSAAMEEAVDYAHANGVTIVACMMNENDNVPYYPSAYTNTIAVGSTNANDERTEPFFWGGGSCYGSHIDVCAPGNYVYGTNHISNTDYEWYWGGTSQATPHVTGLCALLLSQDDTRSPEDLRQILHDTAEDEVGDPAEDVAGFDVYHGWGRINAFNALSGAPANISNSAELLEITAYPNPTSETLRIDALDFNGVINLVDMKGALVKSITFTQSRSINIDVSELNGLFTLQLFRDGHVVHTSNVVVE